MSRIALIGLLSIVQALTPSAGVTQALGSVLLPTGVIRPCQPTQGAHRVFVQGDRLEAAYGLLLERSPTFATALGTIEAANAVRIRIGYREHVMHPSERLLGEDRSGAVFLADGSLFYPSGTILCEVRVVFFTEAVEEALLRAGVPESALVEDLAVMIAHEVYGHLVPFADQPVTAWPTPCRDPGRREGRWATGCAVDRENVIREELGLRPRDTYAQVTGPLLCELMGSACRMTRPGAVAAVASTLPEPWSRVRTSVASSRPAAIPLAARAQDRPAPDRNQPVQAHPGREVEPTWAPGPEP